MSRPLDARLRTVCVVFRPILAGSGISALYFTVTCYDEDSGVQAKSSETDLARLKGSGPIARVNSLPSSASESGRAGRRFQVGSREMPK